MDLSKPITAVVPSLEGQVLRVLAHTTAPLTGAAVARLTRTGSTPGVRKTLGRLVGQGLVRATDVGAATAYTANREHLAWPTIERLVRDTDQLRAELYRRLARIVTDRLGDTTALAIFGSVARGDSDAASDIDLLLVVPDDLDQDAEDAVVDELSQRGAAWTGNDVNVYATTRRGLGDLVRRSDPMIESWARDAVALAGPELGALLSAVPA